MRYVCERCVCVCVHLFFEWFGGDIVSVCLMYFEVTLCVVCVMCGLKWMLMPCVFVVLYCAHVENVKCEQKKCVC